MLNTQTNNGSLPQLMMILGAILILIALFGGLNSTESPTPQIGGGVNEQVIIDETSNPSKAVTDHR